MTGFIFCLIFIQVSIFLIAGVVLVSTFYMGLTTDINAAASGANQPVAETAAARRPAPRRVREPAFNPADVTLTRSELSYLLGT